MYDFHIIPIYFLSRDFQIISYIYIFQIISPRRTAAPHPQNMTNNWNNMELQRDININRNMFGLFLAYIDTGSVTNFELTPILANAQDNETYKSR